MSKLTTRARNAGHPFTVVTGASSGLGKEFCVQCAAKGRNIIMIALPGSNISLFARQLSAAYCIDAEVLEFDITNSMLLLEKLQYINENFEVDCLINNAGVGGSTAMDHASFEAMDLILQVNIRSLVLITRKLLPQLLQKEQSHIINVSSMAAFTPIAYKTVYPASKAFISSFSLGLREEYHRSGLSVSVVYPGPIMTNSNTSERIITQGFTARLGLLSTTAIVKAALEKSFRKKAVIIPGWFNQLNYFLLSVLPTGLSVHLVSNAVKKEINYNQAI